MTTTRTIMRVVTVALLLASATALDVRLRDVQCDGSLPVTIADDGEFKIQCPNSGTDVQRCSFNGDSALLSGNFIYNGVDEAGLTGSNAYLTANIDFVTLEYLLTKNQMVDMCDDNWVTSLQSNQENGDDNAQGDDAQGERRRLEQDAADGDDAAAAEQANENDNAQCDLSDGYYSFSLSYTLPDYEDNTSWLATGWRGTGYIKMFSDDSSMDESLIGSCTFRFDTMVTQSSNGGMTIPTAATTLAIIAGVFALVGAVCCYWSCCRGRRKAKAAAPSDTSTAYKRTQDDGTLASTVVSGSKV
jgi:hypothetical protein